MPVGDSSNGDVDSFKDSFNLGIILSGDPALISNKQQLSTANMVKDLISAGFFQFFLHAHLYPSYEGYPSFGHNWDMAFTWNAETSGYINHHGNKKYLYP